MIGPCPGYTVTGNFNSGDYFNSGTTQVVYYSWFGTEKKDSCKFNVIIVDNEKPVVNCKNITFILVRQEMPRLMLLKLIMVPLITVLWSHTGKN